MKRKAEEEDEDREAGGGHDGVISHLAVEDCAVLCDSSDSDSGYMSRVPPSQLNREGTKDRERSAHMKPNHNSADILTKTPSTPRLPIDCKD